VPGGALLTDRGHHLLPERADYIQLHVVGAQQQRLLVRRHASRPRGASDPSSRPARSRQEAVRSASDRTSFSGRVENVAWARSFMIVAGDGRRPCSET